MIDINLSALDKLYTAIIPSILGGNSNNDMHIMQQCLGAIIVCSTRTPLSVNTLGQLLDGQIEQSVLKFAVDSLVSVLYTDNKQGDVVRVYHPSFTDYITTPARSGRFCVDLQQQETMMTKCCLQAMISGLKFNICGLETSYKRNRDVPDLDARVNRAINTCLRYSCLYWTTHLAKSKKGGNTLLVNDFLAGPTILFWIEALSLMGRLDRALPSIRDVIDWCEVSRNFTGSESFKCHCD
jgi:hypothetical protein